MLVEYPDIIAGDQEPRFTSEEWSAILSAHVIAKHQSAVESHKV